MARLTGTVADMSAEDFVAAISGGAANRGNSTPGIRSGPDSTIDFTKIIGNAAKALGGAAQNVVTKAGGRLSDVAGEFSGALGGMIGYIENTNDVFQSLSKVGAGFDADLGALRASAALTRMPLDQFAGMIAQNTTELAGFSGGVNAGAKRFTQLSYAMFDSNLIENFMDLGMTVEESNDFLMKNMAFDRRRARLENMTDQQQVQSALDLAKSMDVMAKITGKSVQDQQDNMTDRMREGATQAKLRLLEKQGVTGASDAYKQAQQALSGSPKVVGDLLADLTQTGVPLTEATKNFAATNAEAYALLQQSAAATRRGDVGTAERLASRAAAATAAYADSQQGLTLATLGGVSDIAKGQADRLEEVGPLIDAMAEHSAKLEREIGRTPTMIETYNDMLSNAVDIQGRQLGGTLPGQELQQSVREGQLGLANIASTFNTALGEAMSSSTVAQGIFEGMQNFINGSGGILVAGATAGLNIAGGADLTDVSTALSESGDAEGAAAARTLADPTATAADKLEAEALLFEKGIVNADGSMNVTVVNDIFDAGFEAAMSSLQDVPAEERDGMIGFFQRLFGQDVGPDRALGGPVKQGVAHRVGEQGPEMFVPETDGTIIPNMRSEMNRIANLQEKESQQSLRLASLAQLTMPDIAKIMQDEMQQFGAPITEASKNFAATNQGMYNDSMQQSTIALLSGIESAIIPNMKSTISRMPDVAKILQDELQQLGAPMSEASKNFAATNLDSRNMTASNNNNRTLEQKLDILNQTMLQLVSINSTQARTGEKALKASRYNGNLMTGLGRA
jgi:hypothetical protein